MFDERMLADWKTLKRIGWPYSRAHTWRMIKAGSFPAPLKFGKHPGARVAWRWKDVQSYLDEARPATNA